MFRRSPAPDDCVWAQIGSVWPDDRALFHSYLPEDCRIGFKGIEDRPGHERCDISINNRAIAEREPESKLSEWDRLSNSHQCHYVLVVLFQRRDRLGELSCLCELPVLA